MSLRRWQRGSTLMLALCYAVVPSLVHAQHQGGMDHAGRAGQTNTSTVTIGTTQMALEVVGAEPGKVGQIKVRLTDQRDGAPMSGATVTVRVERMDDAKMDSTHRMESMGMEGHEMTGLPALERAEQGVYVREHQFDKSAGTYRITAQVSAIAGRPLDAPFSMTVTHAVAKTGGRGMMGMMHPGMPGGVWGIAIISAAMVGMMVLRVVLF